MREPEPVELQPVRFAGETEAGCGEVAISSDGELTGSCEEQHHTTTDRPGRISGIPNKTV